MHELKKQEVEIARQRLDAEIRAKADADRYREEQQAQAELFKRQERGRSKEVRAAAGCRGKESHGRGSSICKRAWKQKVSVQLVLHEAEAIRAKATAEAEGIDKKAEAIEKIWRGRNYRDDHAGTSR